MRHDVLPAVISSLWKRPAGQAKRTGRGLLAASLALVLLLGAVPLGAATRSQKSARKSSAHKSTAHKSSKHRARRARAKTVRRSRRHRRVRRSARRRHHRRHRRSRGQRAISKSRTLEIQRALIRQNYLEAGQDSGKWDSTTRAALVRYQGDNEWQTKIVPDSRALIKLGLGPKRKNLLNPDTAAIGMRSLALLKIANQSSSANSAESVSN
jgi:hypothetical protein